MIGQTVSHYRIVEKLGQGGMGEVYRAEDTNLHRHVAIKVLPDEFSHDPERLARFEREAKVLPSLNHPKHRRHPRTRTGRNIVVQDLARYDQPCEVGTAQR